MTSFKLLSACKNGAVEEVKMLLEQGGDINVYHDGFTPLFVAAQSGQLGVVKLLLEKGASIDYTNLIDNSTALMVASRNGHEKVVKVLLENGANAEICNSKGISPLTIATYHGKRQIVAALLEGGANVNVGSEDGQYAPVTVATESHQFDVLKLLVSKGAVMDYVILQDSLQSSLKHSRMDVAEVLIQYYPQLAEKAIKRTPTLLHFAVNSKHELSYEVMNRMIEKGADVDHIEPSTQYTPLHYAVSKKQANKTWQLVLHGASTMIVDGNNKTAWDMCAVDDKPTRDALLHYWAPQTHKLHPKWVRDAIICVLMIAKQQSWLFDQITMLHMLSYVAYGWYKPPSNPEKLRDTNLAVATTKE